VYRYYEEELSDEFEIKKSRWKQNKKIFVWTAISKEGPEALNFI
jgi:hypothetical protein